MFSWIRRKVAAAVLNGVNDALETLEASAQRSYEPLPLPEPLRLRLEEAQPEEEAAKPKKARA